MWESAVVRKNMERVQEMITKKSKSLQKPWGKIHFLLITKVEKRRVFVVHTTSTKSPYGRSIFTILLCAWKCAIDWYVRSTLFTFNQETKGLSFYSCLKNDAQIRGNLHTLKVNFKWWLELYTTNFICIWIWYKFLLIFRNLLNAQLGIPYLDSKNTH